MSASVAGQNQASSFCDQDDAERDLLEAIRSGFRLPCDQDELISPVSGSTFSGSTTCWTGADLARRRDLECFRR
jgi:hypothetical protein